MFDSLINFFYDNWSLYLILIIDVFSENNNLLVIMNMENDNIYFKKVFDTLLFNFTYILLPFYNIGIRISQKESNDTQKEFTNLIKLNILSCSILSYICYFIQTLYFAKMNTNTYNFSLSSIALVITSSSLLSCMNGFLVGKNNNMLLLKFNLIYMIFLVLVNNIIIYLNLKNEEVIYIKTIPSIISCIYIFSKFKNNISWKYFFSKDFIIITFGIELVIRNVITLIGLNYNSFILFKLEKEEIKLYELISNKFNNFINIYTPLSPIIQKKLYTNKMTNYICIIYLLIGIFIINVINYLFWNLDYKLLNLYNILYFVVFTNETKNVSNNSIRVSIINLILIAIIKYIIINSIAINSVDSYYGYLIFIFFIKIFFDLIIKKILF